MALLPENPDLFLVENRLYLITAAIGMPTYDFDFASLFEVRHPYQPPRDITAIARMGAAPDYRERYEALHSQGISLIHTPEQYQLASELPDWYPLLEDLTARSIWFDSVPSLSDITPHFSFPFFMKGQRQTSRHQRSLSIIESPQQFQEAIDTYQEDPLLRWQRIVVREFLPLRPAGVSAANTLPVVFEFRSFWYRQQLVGIGPYWIGQHYVLSAAELAGAVATGQEAANRLRLPFVVLDLAQTVQGKWVVIECNDAQDSGYAGVQPLPLWRRVLDLT